MIEIGPFLFIGTVVIFGFLLGKVTQWVRLTSIVGYIIAGIIIGPLTHLIVLPPDAGNLIVNFTLAIVAFIIGLSFSKAFIRRTGKMVVKITIVESLITFVAVTLGVYILTWNLPIALILGALGPATAPAGTMAAIHDCKARGNLSRITIGVVGLDDAIAVIIFVIGLATVRLLIGGGLSLLLILEIIFMEIGVAIFLGILMGTVLAYTTKILKHKEDIFIIAIGAILLCAGIAEMIGASSILACMLLGVAFINISPRSGRTINRSIEGIIAPIFVVFFVVAGLELRPELLIPAGVLGVVYIISRIIGKYSGANLGSRFAKVEPKVQKYLGFALLSQAGVAIGLALLVSHELAGLEGGVYLGALAITIITATTVVFEIIGPISLRFAVTKAMEVPKKVK